MDRQTIARRGLSLLVVAMALSSVLLVGLAHGKALADSQQLRNDNGDAEGYTSGIRPGFVFGSVLQADSSAYPLRVQSVDVLLYRYFPGAATTALVRAGIWSIGPDGRPDALLGRSGVVAIDTFYPDWVSIPLTGTQVVLSSPAPFLAAIEYLDGAPGTIPSVMLDSSRYIPVGYNYYSQTHGDTWFEHYDWWVSPEDVGYNMVRATVETDTILSPTWTPRPTSTPTPGPSPTPIQGLVGPGRMAGTGKQHLLARTSDGRVHLVYTADTNQQLLHLWSANNGEEWHPSPPLAIEEVPAPEAALAVGPDQALHLVYGSWDGKPAYYRSYDGRNWSAPMQVGERVFGRNIAVDGRGVVHVVWSFSDVWYTRLDRTGWSTPRRIASGGWHPAIAVGPDDSLHVAYNDAAYCCDYSGVEVRYIQSTDGGLTWSSPENVSQDGQWSGGASLVVTPDRAVHVTYISRSSIIAGALYYRQKRGAGWSARETVSSGNAGVDTGSTGWDSAAMAADAAGNVFVVFRYLNAAQRWDICVRIRDHWYGWQPVLNLTNYSDTNAEALSVAYGLIPAGGGLDIVWRANDKIVYRYVHREEMGLRPTPTPSPTPTPTPGAFHVRVVDEGGRPVDGARIYRNGALVVGPDGLPLLTRNGGVLDFPSLEPGDTLAALVAVEQQPTVRQAHDGDPDPRFPGQQWAYRVHLTSLDIAPDGSPTQYRVPSPSAGEHRLVVRKTNTLVLFNVVASIEWDADAGYMNEISTALRLASDYLYDVTDGQMALGSVAIYDNGLHWADADIQFSTRNTTRPHAYIGGIVAQDPSRVIRVGRYWSGVYSHTGRWDAPAGFRTLVHEFAHYALHLYDEYFGYRYNASGEMAGTEIRDCTGPSIRATPYSGYATNASIMDYQYNASELWTAGLSPAWDDACRQTVQWQINAESDWQTVARVYADRQSPVRWEIITPALRGGTVAGPESMPLSLPAVKVHNTTSPPAKTLTVYAYWGGPYWGAQVTLYTRRSNQVVPLDQGMTNQNGSISVLGALPGDTVRAASFDGAYAGMVEVGEDEHYTLMLSPVSAQAAAAGTAVNPHVSLVPSSDGRSLYVRAYGIGAGRSLRAMIRQAGQPSSQATDLAYSNASGAYEGTVVFEEAALGGGDVWLSEAGQQSGGIQIHSPFVLYRVRNDEAGDLFSGDGNLHLRIAAGSLPGSEAYVTIVSLSAPPAAPAGFTLAGSTYDVRFSGAMTTLTRPGLLTMHYPAEARASASPETLDLYAWDPVQSQWQAANASLCQRDASLSRAVQRTGIYALIAAQDLDNKTHLPLVERHRSR